MILGSSLSSWFRRLVVKMCVPTLVVDFAEVACEIDA